MNTTDILELIDETLNECEYRADNDDSDVGFLYEGSWDHSAYEVKR